MAHSGPVWKAVRAGGRGHPDGDDWLTRQGFQEIKVGAGRTAIEFSGSVGQVRNAFHTEIHQLNVTGESRQANLSDPRFRRR